MPVRIARALDGIDWSVMTSDLRADDFDNGRTPAALRRSFEQSQHVAIAWDGDDTIGTARLLSDGVCNAYLVDVWTRSTHRRQSVATAMVRDLMARVPGQHIALQTDDAQAFYASLGFRPQPELYSIVVGTWLDNDANRAR
jgi:predicted GNAT family acetyltransferase